MWNDSRHGQREERTPGWIGGVDGLDARKVDARLEARGVDLDVEGLGPPEARLELELRGRLDPFRFAAQVEVEVEGQGVFDLVGRALEGMLEEGLDLDADDDAADGRRRGDLPRVAEVDAARVVVGGDGDLEGGVLGGLA